MGMQNTEEFNLTQKKMDIEEKNFFASIFSDNFLRSEDGIESIFEQFPTIIGDRLENAKYLSVYLASALIKPKFSKLVTLNELCVYQTKYLNEIAQCNSVDEVESVFKNLLFTFKRIDSKDCCINEREENCYVSKCKKYILKHIDKKITPEQIASEIGLTPAYLSTVFHQSAGITIVEYIQRSKINEAKKILVSSNDKISKIANKLEFSTPSYFCRVFEKIVGETPQQYRTRQLQHLYMNLNETAAEVMDS